MTEDDTKTPKTDADADAAGTSQPGTKPRDAARQGTAASPAPLDPPLPAPMTPERRAELERLLEEEFADGEDVDEDDGDPEDQEFYFPR